MLETYFEEIARKRRGRRIFWVAVFGFASFLYLFFQGYYPYVRIDFAEFFDRQSSETSQKPQVVRAFGIINVRTSPAPDRISVHVPWLGEKTFNNDDKGFFDFGKYGVRIEKAGFVPISLEVLLNKQNAFSINVLNLLKNPEYSKFSIPVDRIDPLESGNFLVREKVQTVPSASALPGRIYRLLGPDFSPLSGSGLRTDARPIGGGYFEKAGIPLFFDSESRTLKPVPRPIIGNGSGPCFDAAFRGSEIRCPKTGTAISLRNSGLRERFLGFGGRLVRTEKETVRTENGHLIAIEPLVTASGAKAGNPFRLAGKPYRLTAGTAVPENAEDAGKLSIPLDSVASVHEFGSESILFWYLGNDAAFVLVDERGNFFPGKIPGAKLAELSVEPLLWAYVFRTDKIPYLYYRSSTELVKIVETDGILGFWNGIGLFEKNGTTYRLELHMGERP